MKRIGICVAAAVLLVLAPLTASAHIRAMVNYESKTEEGLHAHGIKDHGQDCGRDADSDSLHSFPLCR